MLIRTRISSMRFGMRMMCCVFLALPFPSQPALSSAQTTPNYNGQMGFVSVGIHRPNDSRMLCLRKRFQPYCRHQGSEPNTATKTLTELTSESEVKCCPTCYEIQQTRGKIRPKFCSSCGSRLFQVSYALQNMPTYTSRLVHEF